MAFAHPVLLVGLAILVPAVWILERRADGSPRRRVARALVRSALLGLLVVALAAPALPQTEAGRRRLVVAIEQSAELGTEGAREADALAQAAIEDARSHGIPATILAFGASAGSATVAGDAWRPPPPVNATQTPQPAAGVAAARLAFRPGEDGTILLLASGHGALAGLEREAEAAVTSGLRVKASALPREAPLPPPTGPQVTALDLPPRVRAPFDLRARFVARGVATAQVLVDGQSVARQAVAPPTDGLPRDLLVPDVPAAPGPREVTLLLADGEGNETIARRLVMVEAPPRALLVEEGVEPHPIGRALTVQGFQVTSLPPLGLGAALASAVPAPDVVLLDSDITPLLPPAVVSALKARVKEGLGLVVLAGRDEEAWAGLATSPLAEALPLLALAPPRLPPRRRLPRPRPPSPIPSSPPTRRRTRA